MSTFPLFLETYRVGQRNYRRNPYASEPNRSNLGTFEDVPDIYGDESCDGPSCAIGSRKQDYPSSSTAAISAPGEVAAPKKQKRDRKPGASAGNLEPENYVQCEEDSRVSFCNGKWMASVDVPPMLVARLIGTRGAVLREMEDSTSCRVTIPRRGEEGPVVVRSVGSLENVSRCLDRIEIILADARKSSRFTHFVAVSCMDPEVVHNFELFKEKVLAMETAPESVKDEDLFQKSFKLHLTVTMLWIFDKIDQDTADKTLQGVVEKIRNNLMGKPLIANIHGVATMNDDPAHTDVLYAVVKGEQLQKTVDLITKSLQEANIAPEGESGTEQHVKMHMTLMNSRFKSQSAHGKRHSFDASAILAEMRDWDFGSIPIREISVCCLSSGSRDKFYEKLFVHQL